MAINKQQLIKIIATQISSGTLDFYNKLDLSEKEDMTLFVTTLSAYDLTLITTLNLYQCNINSDGMMSLAPTIGKLTHLSSLLLAENKIGPEGVKALSLSIADLQKISTLALSGCDIQSEGLETLSKNLPPHLKNLYLCHNNIVDVPIDITGKGLKTLELSGNHIPYEQLAKIEALIHKPYTINDIYDASSGIIFKFVVPNDEFGMLGKDTWAGHDDSCLIS